MSGENSKYKIPEFPEYSVDINGNVYGKKGQKLKPASAGQGKYLKVSLMHKGKPYNKYVHRLIAETFIPNPENKYSVNHKDGNKYNNCVSNLEWATGTEQNNHAYKNKLKLAGENCNLSKLTEKDVIEIRNQPNLKLKELAKKYNVTQGLISMIRNRIIWKQI